MTYGHFIDGHIKDNPTCYAAHVAAQKKIADQNKARFFGGSTKPANAKADGGSRAPAFDPAEKGGLQKSLDPNRRFYKGRAACALVCLLLASDSLVLTGHEAWLSFLSLCP